MRVPSFCRRRLLHHTGWLALALTSGLGVSGCDDNDHVILGSPATLPDAATGELVVDPGAPVIAGFTAIGSCAMEQPACGRDGAAPCTLRCATHANGCLSYSEYVPLA